MIESNIDFCFKDKFTAFKFDETEYYKKYTNGIKEGKGVDFIAFSDKEIVFVEVKNCMGHEKENEYRIHAGNENSFDVEVSQKVNCSLACLTASQTFDEFNKPKCISSEFVRSFNCVVMPNCEISVILYLEGDFNMKTRNKKMIMSALQEKLKNHFKGWLNVQRVKVIDSTVENRYFDAKQM